MQQPGRFFRESHTATVEFVLDSHWSQDCNDRFRQHDPSPAGPKALVVGHRALGILGNLRHFHHSGTHQVLQLGRQGCKLWFPHCNPAGQDQANMCFTMSLSIGNQHHHVATPDDVGSGTEMLTPWCYKIKKHHQKDPYLKSIKSKKKIKIKDNDSNETSCSNASTGSSSTELAFAASLVISIHFESRDCLVRNSGSSSASLNSFSLCSFHLVGCCRH